MKRQILILLILFHLTYNLSGQVVAKTITFDSINVPSGSCYIEADGTSQSQPEDPAIIIDCASGGRLFSSEWSINIPVSGVYILPSAWAVCSSGSSFVLDPVNTTTVTSLNISVQTMEGDDHDCNNTAGPPDDCINTSTFLLDILLELILSP